MTLDDLDGFASWETAHPWSNAEPVGMKEGEPFEMTMAWDTFGNDFPGGPAFDSDEPREMVLTFNRWQRLRFIYRWFGRWLPRRFFKTFTVDAKLSKYKVVILDEPVLITRCTFMPVGVGRWS